MDITIITLIALFLRLVLANQSFWLDEGASIMLARLSLPQLLGGIKYDFHPPLFYALLHYWLPLAGKTEWLIRLPFILLATTTIPAVYYLCRGIFGDKSRIPLLSALFLALNPLHIFYSQELRMYSLVTLFVCFSWYFLLKENYFWTSVLNVLSFFAFYGAIFSFFAQVVYLLFNKSKDIFKILFYISAPLIILFLLWWPIFSIQLQNGNYLSNVLPGWKTLSGTLTIKSLFLIPLKFVLGRIAFEPQKLYYLIGGLMVLIFTLIASYSIKNKKTLPIWVGLVGPLFFGLLVSLKTPVLGYWRFLFILPFFMVVLAAGADTLSKTIYLGTVVWICGTFIFFNLFFWTNPRFHREDWRGMSLFVDNKDSALLLAFPYSFAPLNFYLSKGSVVPTLDTSYQLTPATMAMTKDKIFERKVIYYLDYLADVTDPERKILKSLHTFGLRQTVVYNFNGLGQVYEFQKK